MAASNDKSPAIVRLKYKKGELIAKEGDYGISVYKVVKGEAELFTSSGDIEMIVKSVKKDGLIDEAVFINQGSGARELSARAEQDTEIDVWHLRMLNGQYESLPPLIRHMVSQTIQRLIRTQSLADRLEAEKPVRKEKPKAEDKSADDSSESWAAQKRRFYRKSLDQICLYAPSSGSKGVKLEGRLTRISLKGKLKDISRGGAGVEISETNKDGCKHDVGDEFIMNVTLPDGQKIDFKAKIAHVKPAKTPGCLFLGMTISEIGYESQKRLGFYLMP